MTSSTSPDFSSNMTSRHFFKKAVFPPFNRPNSNKVTLYRPYGFGNERACEISWLPKYSRYRAVADKTLQSSYLAPHAYFISSHSNALKAL